MPYPLPDENWSSAAWDQPEADSDDQRIEALVAQRLSIDWTTRRQQISVAVQSHVVILTGLVGDTEARQAAGELAWDVPGVFDVCNALRVGGQRRSRR